MALSRHSRRDFRHHSNGGLIRCVFDTVESRRVTCYVHSTTKDFEAPHALLGSFSKHPGKMHAGSFCPRAGAIRSEVFGCPGDHLLASSHTPAMIRSSFVARDSQVCYNHLTASRLLRARDDSVLWHGQKVSPLPTLAFRGRAIDANPSSERPNGIIFRGHPSDFANK